jgi:hypothetical protein
MIHARLPRLFPVATLVVASLTFARLARASDPARALTLYAQGKELLAKGRYDAAREKLAASEAEHAAPETLLDIGRCNEALGRFASAWLTYRDARTLARSLGKAEQMAVAAERATAALKKVSRLRVNPPPTVIDGLGLSCNGDLLPTAAVGAALPVDPGTYTIAASAPGRVASSVTVEVGKDAEYVVVQVPALESLALGAAPIRDSRPPIKWTFVGGGGVLRVGSGAVGLLALKQVKRPPIDLMLCPDKQCLSEGRRQIEAAETRKLISTIGAGVGGPSACAGVYVLIPKTRGQFDSDVPRASPLSASLPSGAALIVRGAF